MEVLLVNPRFPYHGLDKFPLGLAYIAGVLNGNEKIKEICVVDELVQRKAESKIEELYPDVVCITSTTPSFKRACEIAEFANELGCKVVMGGVHATFRPEEALDHAHIVVRGEGEKTVEELFEKIGGKTSLLKGIKGISFKVENEIFHNPPRKFIENLDSLPMPAYELFPLKKYKVMSLVTSRGCFYNCAYCCATRFWGRRVRFHSVERVVSEFEKISSLGFRSVKVHDSTFTLNRERVVKICVELIKRKINIAWSCETRADHLDKELLEIMQRAGCFFICMGIDSADENVLRKNKRFFDLKHAEKVFKWCKELGIKTRAYVVFGLEGETKESVEKTLEYLRRIEPDQIMLSLATAYPGTELEKGELMELPHEFVSKFEGHGRGAKLYKSSTLTLEEYMKLAEYMREEIEKLKSKKVT